MTGMRVLSGCVVCLVVATASGCGATTNPAREVADHVLDGLAPVHPVVTCDNGDAGTGLDNTVPWQTTYLVVDDTAELDRTATAAVAKAGYRLAVDPHVSRGSQDDGGTGEVPGVPFDPDTSYLVASVDGAERVRVTVVRSGGVTMYCAGPRWAEPATAQPGRPIVMLQVTLPDRAG